MLHCAYNSTNFISQFSVIFPLCWSSFTAHVSCEWLDIAGTLCVQLYDPVSVVLEWHNSAYTINKYFSLFWSRHSIDSSLSMYRNSLFCKVIDTANNLITSQFPLLTPRKIITYVSTTSFMYVCRSPSSLSKFSETLLWGKRTTVA
jgi:hypothetical protein